MTRGDGVTVDTLKRILEAFNRHDLDAIMAFFADESGTRRRTRAVRALLRRLAPTSYASVVDWQRGTPISWVVFPASAKGHARYRVTLSAPVDRGSWDLYLAPSLERPDVRFEDIVCVAAHELAHALLNHRSEGDPSARVGDPKAEAASYRDELAAWQKVMNWQVSPRATWFLERTKYYRRRHALWSHLLTHRWPAPSAAHRRPKRPPRVPSPSRDPAGQARA